MTGQDLREPVICYEWAKPGDLIHVDVKKLGRIPAGGGWRIHGRGSAQHQATERAKTVKNGAARAGYVYLHTAIDDHSRLAYTEELLDEKGVTAAGFWARAVKFFKRHGIRRVLTDNGACYRSFAFAGALTATRTRHKWTRPYRPQTNGKVERYHRTLAREWANQRAWNSNEVRCAALTGFLDRYNYRRPHTALGGQPPISRVTTDVTNVAA